MDDSPPWWMWPNILALDAPAVAVVWQGFLAAAAGIEVPPAARFVLGLTVWGIYLADRWLDGCAATDRHRFAERHPHLVAGIASVALAAAGVLALFGLPERYFTAGGVVVVISILYLAIVHLVRAQRIGFSGLKELSVGIVFAVGTGIPLLADTAPKQCEWIAGIAAFAGLCSLNCLLICRWEEESTEAPAMGTAVAVGLIATAASPFAERAVFLAVLASLGLLLALDCSRARYSKRALRVLADAVLLTPPFVWMLQ